MKKRSWHQWIGWLAVALSTAIACLWAFWGIVENFHEGWYYDSIWSNLGMMFAQYLSPMLIFVGVALVAIFWPRFGGGLHVLLAVLAIGFFQAFTNAAVFLLILPLVGMGVLYWFGRPQPRRLAAGLVIGLPLLTLTLAGIEPISRVSRRIDDGYTQARSVKGNGVELIWAPEGPGWPRRGTDWHGAQRACQFLSEDGLALEGEPQGTWRLPTVDEVVRSMSRGGQNSGGIWDGDRAEATYETTPDKESPLWNTRSQVIYWWTATAVDEGHAYMIVYDGRVWPRNKEFGPDYLGFRCVK